MLAWLPDCDALLPDWETDAWVAIGTLALAGVTLLLALVTAAQVRITRRSLQATLRPLLVDTPVADGEVDASSDDEGVVEIEVPLRNAGPGLGLIVGGPRLQWTEHPPEGWTGLSQNLVVLSGENVRLTFRQTFPDSEAANTVALAAVRFEVEVDFTDVNGKQWTRAKAYIGPNSEEALFVQRIELFQRNLLRRVARKPFASLTGGAST